MKLTSKSTVASMASGIAIASLLSIGVMTGWAYKSDKEHAKLVQEQTTEAEITKKSDDDFNKWKQENKRDEYTDDASDWVQEISRMPSSKERTTISANIVDALKDGAITDKEYDAIITELRAIRELNAVREIREEAAKFAPSDQSKPTTITKGE